MGESYVPQLLAVYHLQVSAMKAGLLYKHNLTACYQPSVSLELQLRHADVGNYPLSTFKQTDMKLMRMVCRNEPHHPLAFASHDHSAPVRSMSARISASMASQILVAALISDLELPRLCEPYKWLLACRVVLPPVA